MKNEGGQNSKALDTYIPSHTERTTKFDELRGKIVIEFK